MKGVSHAAVIRALCARLDVPEPTPEHRFAAPRRWRFDLAWVPSKVALEVQGAIWTNGRHARGSGLLKEYEKMNAAAAAGWRICYCTPQTLIAGVEAVAVCLKGEK